MKTALDRFVPRLPAAGRVCTLLFVCVGWLGALLPVQAQTTFVDGPRANYTPAIVNLNAVELGKFVYRTDRDLTAAEKQQASQDYNSAVLYTTALVRSLGYSLRERQDLVLLSFGSQTGAVPPVYLSAEGYRTDAGATFAYIIRDNSFKTPIYKLNALIGLQIESAQLAQDISANLKLLGVTGAGNLIIQTVNRGVGSTVGSIGAGADVNLLGVKGRVSLDGLFKTLGDLRFSSLPDGTTKRAIEIDYGKLQGNLRAQLQYLNDLNVRIAVAKPTTDGQVQIIALAPEKQTTLIQKLIANIRDQIQQKDVKTTGSGEAGQPLSLEFSGDFFFDKSVTFLGYGSESFNVSTSSNVLTAVPTFNVRAYEVRQSSTNANFPNAAFYSTTLNQPNLGGVDFASLDLAGLDVDSASQTVQFLIGGTAGSSQTSQVSAEVANYKKVFRQALAIPNANQTVSLDIVSNGAGGFKGLARTDADFKRTDLCRYFYEADVQLKKDLLGSIFNQGLIREWQNLVAQSPYISSIISYPIADFNLRVVIYPELPTGGQGSRRVFLDQARLNVRREITSLTLNLPALQLTAGANRAAVEADLTARLATYRALLAQRMDDGVQNIVLGRLNSGAGGYANLYQVVKAVVAAQWYKTLPNPERQFADVVDSKNLSGYETSTPFDQAFWDGQAYQLLGTEVVQSANGSFSVPYMGGVEFNQVRFTSLSQALSLPQNQALDDARTASVVEQGNARYASAGGVVVQVPDFSIARIEVDPIDGVSVGPLPGRDVRLRVTVQNTGNVAATNVRVDVYVDRVTGASFSQLQSFTIASLPAGGSAIITRTFNNATTADYKVMAVVNISSLFVNTFTPQAELTRANNRATRLFTIWPDAGVRILSPTDASVIPGKNAALWAEVPEGIAVEWRSDKDGVLGTTPTLIVPQLSAGSHILTLKATTVGGLIITKTVNINTFAQTAPVASITAPAANAALLSGQVVTLQATASTNGPNATTVNLCDAGAVGQVEWSSSLDGVLGRGCSLSTTLSVGTHTITLKVTNQSLQITTLTRTVVVSSGSAAINAGSGLTATCVTGNTMLDGLNFTKPTVYSAAGTLRVKNVVVNSPTSMELFAGDSVVLKPGFTAAAGSTFTAYIAGCAPTLAIMAPAANAALTSGQIVTLTGTATTNRLGRTSVDMFVEFTDNVSWTSSRDGYLGNKSSLPTALSVGTHTITLSATNDGKTTSVTRTVTVSSGSAAINGGTGFTAPCASASLLTLDGLNLTKPTVYSTDGVLSVKSVTVNSPTTMALSAGQAVVLLPGFTAAAGSTFRATIGDCSAGTPQLRTAPAGPTASPAPAVRLAEVGLYPNPAGDAVTLQVTLAAADEVGVVLRDLNGRVVKVLASHTVAGEGTTELPYSLAEVPNGIYLVEIKGAQHTFRSQRLVIAR